MVSPTNRNTVPSIPAEVTQTQTLLDLLFVSEKQATYHHTTLGNKTQQKNKNKLDPDNILDKRPYVTT